METTVKFGGILAIVLLLMCCFVIATHAAELNVPTSVTAGSGLSIPSSGSGSATLYLVGPGTAIKRKVQLGQEIQIGADELQNAGRYVIFARRRHRDVFCYCRTGALDRIPGTAIAGPGRYEERHHRHGICVRQISEPGARSPSR